MEFPRRRVLQLAAGAAALPVLSRGAAAQAYPARPVRMIVGFPAGSAPDIVARLVGQWLGDRLGQQFIVDNRPGFASNIATELAVAAPADGYTVQMIVLTNVMNAALYSKLKFNFPGDITPIAGVADAPYIILLNPSIPAKTIPEFITYAKANPGKINFASGGNGSTSHIFCELLQRMAGIELLHVPYRTNYMPDLISGQVHFAVNPIPQAIEFVRNGQLRGLAVTTAERLPQLPDMPTVRENGPAYVATGWYGLSAPKNTPPEIVNRLNAAMNEALADPTAKERLANLGVQPLPMSAAQFAKFINDEAAKWTPVIQAAGLKLD
jgi:tripartite-type tricarboxylate transporter receptor subunit TctC